MGDPPFRALADTMALGMAYQMLVSPDGSQRRFIYVSESCEALNGISVAQALADPKALYDLISPQDRPQIAQAEANALSAGSSFHIEVEFHRPDGSVRWNRIAAAPRPLPWPDGSILWDGIQIDITERKRIELELAEQRRRLDMAVEATGLGLWEWDVRNERVIWSNRNKALFGLPADAEIDLQGYMQAVHPEDISRVQQAYRAVRDLPQGGDFSVEHRVIMPNGRVRWLLAHGRILTDAAGVRLAVGTSLDVTERRTAEEHRALLMGELAHRAKNGLSVIMAIVNQTARGATSVQHYQEQLIARLHAMAQSQDLITASGGRPLRLSDLVAKVLEPFSLSRFEVGPGLDEVEVNGDVGIGIALLLHEMATNAVKYGALSVVSGRVRISRVGRLGGSSQVEWREIGGPPVTHCEKPGFGTRMMQAVLRNLGGKVEARFEPGGFIALLDIPTA
jgi:PAS domain S-box-containing protein